MKKVFKFGGTSLESIEKIQSVAEFISGKAKHCELAVVVSAMGKTTNKLVELANSLGDENSSFKAGLITLGENISSFALALALEKNGTKCEVMNAQEIPILTHGDPLNSLITSVGTKKLEERMKENVVIIPGFQGVNEEGKTTCLGRGGSDTTAVALASVLSCKAYIFTDVDGYYLADPNKFQTRKLKKINIHSAIESAYNSSKVLDKRCLELANKTRAKVEVLRSLKASGTKLSFAALEGYVVDSISYKTELIFVKNNIKMMKNIQNAFKKCNITPLIFEKYGDGNAVFLAEKGSLSPQKASFLGEEAEQVVLTGSGLTLHHEFFEKVQNVLSKHEIKVKFLCLHPTVLKIVTERGVAENLVRLLIRELNL